MTESAAQSVPSSNSDSGKLGQPRDRHWVRRLVRGVCVFALIPYVAITILLTLFQRQLIYHRSPSPPLLLADAGFTQDAGRDVSLTTDDGLTLHGWLLNANGVRDGVGDRWGGHSRSAASACVVLPRQRNAPSQPVK